MESRAALFAREPLLASYENCRFGYIPNSPEYGLGVSCFGSACHYKEDAAALARFVRLSCPASAATIGEELSSFELKP